MSQSPSLRIELRPSFFLAGALASAHLLALGASAAALHGWPLILVAAGILLSGAVTLARALHRAGGARALELDPDGRCAWRDGAGRWHEARLRGQQFASPALVVLALEGDAPEGKRIVLLPDSCDRDGARRLRGWLRWRAESAQRRDDAEREIPAPTAEERPREASLDD
jgi:membrane-bound toxin of toxin-antitoxin system